TWWKKASVWVDCWERRKSSSPPSLNCKAAAMLHTPNSTPSSTREDREARIQALMEQLRPASEQALRHMAEELVDAPDSQLFGAVELRLRDHAHELAATVHQTCLARRHKGGTRVQYAPILKYP